MNAGAARGAAPAGARRAGRGGDVHRRRDPARGHPAGGVALIAGVEDGSGCRWCSGRPARGADRGGRARLTRRRCARSPPSTTSRGRARHRPGRCGSATSWAALGRHTTAVLQRWRDGHPEVPLEVHRVDERSAGLTSGLADIAVVRGELRCRRRHRSEPVFREPRWPRCRPVIRSPGGTPSRSPTSREQSSPPAYGTTTLDLWPPTAARSIGVDNTDEWLTAIAAGLAVGVTPEATANQHPHPGVGSCRWRTRRRSRSGSRGRRATRTRRSPASSTSSPRSGAPAFSRRGSARCDGRRSGAACPAPPPVGPRTSSGTVHRSRAVRLRRTPRAPTRRGDEHQGCHVAGAAHPRALELVPAVAGSRADQRAPPALGGRARGFRPGRSGGVDERRRG